MELDDITRQTLMDTLLLRRSPTRIRLVDAQNVRDCPIVIGGPTIGSKPARPYNYVRKGTKLFLGQKCLGVRV